MYFILIIAAVIAFGEANIYNWQDKPYGNDDFNARAKFGENVTLHCNDTRVAPGYAMKYWILPNLDTMAAGDDHYFSTPVDGISGWVVDSATDAMHIINVHGEQFGFYYCVVEEGGEDKIIKRGLNYQGPYFGDLWPDYEMNVIVGCSAAGGLIVIIVVIYLVSEFYYDPKEHDRSGSGSFDLSAPGSSSMSDGSDDYTKQGIESVEYLGNGIEHGMDNEIKQIFSFQQPQQAKF